MDAEDFFVHVQFTHAYNNGSMVRRRGAVRPGRIIACTGLLPVKYHEVCVSFTDNRGNLRHDNVDVCHLTPAHLDKKGQTGLIIRTDYEGCRVHMVKRYARTDKIVHFETKGIVPFKQEDIVRLIRKGEEKFCTDVSK